MLYMAFEWRGSLCCNEQEKAAGGRKKQTTTIQEQNMSTFRNTHGHFWQTSKDNHEKTIMWKERTQTWKHTRSCTQTAPWNQIYKFTACQYLQGFVRLHWVSSTKSWEGVKQLHWIRWHPQSNHMCVYECVRVCKSVCVRACVVIIWFGSKSWYLTVNRDGLWPWLDVWERGEGGSWVDCFVSLFFFLKSTKWEIEPVLTLKMDKIWSNCLKAHMV